MSKALERRRGSRTLPVIVRGQCSARPGPGQLYHGKIGGDESYFSLKKREEGVGPKLRQGKDAKQRSKINGPRDSPCQARTAIHTFNSPIHIIETSEGRNASGLNEKPVAKYAAEYAKGYATNKVGMLHQMLTNTL